MKKKHKFFFENKFFVMSSVNVTALFASAQQSKATYTARKEEKSIRVQECIKQFNEKCDTLIKKYFDEDDEYSINKSLERAVAKSGRTDAVDLHMNFNRDDFTGWHKFVPFQADEFGRNYNARPASCLNLFLARAKHLGYLPQISFVVWGNRKFTVKFTLRFNESSLDVSDVFEPLNDVTTSQPPNLNVDDESVETKSATSA